MAPGQAALAAAIQSVRDLFAGQHQGARETRTIQQALAAMGRRFSFTV